MIRYASIRPRRDPLRRRPRELAHVRVSYGYRRLHVLLKREGWAVNHKLVHRLYTEEGLTQKRKARSGGRVPWCACCALNRVRRTSGGVAIRFRSPAGMGNWSS
ncbi:MAG: IS3 family transposase [Gemmatimonadaceae bacterium]